MVSDHETNEWREKKIRERVIRHSTKQIFISNIIGSRQEKDLSLPPNCSGFGRIRHFRRNHPGWLQDPLPIDPAVKALGLENVDEMTAQVFQLGACNWKCWYCFVDNDLLSADYSRGSFMKSGNLIDLYLQEKLRPLIIDLSGGYPDLAPEWTLWMMQELINRGLERKTYLWTDDNLSTEYLIKYLDRKQIDFMIQYPNYGRVGCFKGYDEFSFAYNTKMDGSLWNEQFNILRKINELGFDIYSYVTFTTPSIDNVKDNIAIFMDKLQQINVNLPLRTVPLEIKLFNPAKSRQNSSDDGTKNQYIVADFWKNELSQRFQSRQLSMNIADVHLSRSF